MLPANVKYFVAIAQFFQWSQFHSPGSKVLLCDLAKHEAASFFQNIVIHSDMTKPALAITRAGEQT